MELSQWVPDIPVTEGTALTEQLFVSCWIFVPCESLSSPQHKFCPCRVPGVQWKPYIIITAQLRKSVVSLVLYGNPTSRWSPDCRLALDVLTSSHLVYHITHKNQGSCWVPGVGLKPRFIFKYRFHTPDVCLPLFPGIRLTWPTLHVSDIIGAPVRCLVLHWNLTLHWCMACQLV